MKKIQIYKDAFDFAFSDYQQTDALVVSQSANAHFIEQKFDSRDYPYWLMCFNQAKQQFVALAQQASVSAALDEQAARIKMAAEPAVAPKE